MPKISAPTVGEHRAARHSALVRAAVEVLRESGLAGATPRAVCERAGLTRSSFYDYFPSRDDLLVAVAIDAFEQWDAEIKEQVLSAESGLPRLRALVESTMRMSADGRHEIAGILRQAPFAPTRMDELMVLHDALMRPLRDVVVELGVPEPDQFTMLAQGVVGAGIEMIEHGADPEATAEGVFRMLAGGVPR